MKKKIGIVSLLLVLALVLVLLPGMFTEAEAAAASSITVNGYNLPSGYYLPTATWTKTTTKPSGSYFYYSSGTLTMYNVTLTGSSGTRAVYAEGDLVVSLSGTNKLTTTNAYGIRSTGTLKFTGSGSLTVNSSGYDAIYSSGNMEFAQTGTVTTTATGHSSSGVECGAKLTIGGNLNATAESSYAIFATGDISMTKGTVNATGNCTYSAGGIRSNGAITVSGGTLNVNSKSDGIIAKNDFWQKAGNVTVNADWNGIIVESTTNDARINEGTLTVTAVRDGIKARKFFMNGGHGYIKSTNTSSDSSYYAVKLAGNTSTYFYMQGSVKANGSTTTSSSGLTSLTYANLPTYDYVFFTGYIYVNGVELRDGHYLQSGKTITNTSKPSGGYAHYSGNTLTLNNYEGSSTSASGIYSRYDLNIVLAQGSTNKLTTSTTNGTTYRGISVSGALKISGLGQLTISGGQYAIFSSGTLTIGTSVIKTYGSGIYSGSTINLDGAMLDMTNINSYSGMAYAIKTNYNLYIDGGAIGIYAPNKVTLSGTSSAVGVTGIYANYIETSASMGLEVSGNAIQSASKVYISGGTLDIQVTKDDTYGVEAKEISISGGTVNIGGDSDRGYAYSMHATDKITISGGSINVDFDNNTFGSIECDADMVISGGSVNIKSYHGLDADKLTISGGIVDISTDIGSISARVANFTGGMVTTRNTSSKAPTYGRVNMTSDTFIVADHLAAIGSDESSGKGYEVLTINGLKTYHYLAIGEFVMLHDVILPTGHFLESGNSKNTVSTSGPSSGDYAYYEDGVLTLCDYEYSGTSMAVRAFADLTVELTGGSKINHIMSHAGDLTFKGTGALEIKRNMANDAVNVIGDVHVQNGLLTINGSGGSGIECNHFYLDNGKVWVTANFDGITVKNGLTINGGVLVAKSTGTTNDTLYSAINPTTNSPTISIKSGLNHMVGTTSEEDNRLATNFASGDYDFAALGDFVMVQGQILPYGNYMKSGTKTPIQNSVADGYAYYAGNNRLILKNYSNSGAEYGIASNVDLTIVLDGSSTVESKNKSVSEGGGLYGVKLFDAINVAGNLTIEGRTTSTDSLIAKSQQGEAIYVDGKLTIKGDSITAITGGSYSVSAGDFSLTGGTLNVTSTQTSSDSYAYGLWAVNSLNVSGGTLNVTAPINHGIYVEEGSMTVSGGTVKITSSNGNGIVINKGNLTISGGEMTVTALEHAIELKKERVNISGGFLVASSTSTDKDSTYYALKLPGTASSYYNVASSLSQAASPSGSKTALEKLDNSRLSSYDYIQIGKYIEIAGKTVKSGYSIKSDGTIVSGNAGAGSAYYVSEYAGNTLTLNGFNCTTSSVRGIEAFSDVTIKVTGNSTVTTAGYHGIFATGNVAFTGSNALTVNSGSYGLKAIGNVTVTDVTLTLDSSSTTALSTDGDVTVNSGFLKAFGYHNGIYAGKVDIKGGNLIANSSFNGADNNYCAIEADSFTYASDLYVAGSASSGTTGMEIYDSAKRSDYDYIYVGDFVLIGGTFLPDGYYLSTGSSTPTISASAYNYAYYSNGELFLVNYTYSGDYSMRAPHDLELNMTGTNSYTSNYDGIYIVGNLTISGNGSLTVSSTYNGVFADALTLKGGQFTAISTNTSSDSYYKALAVSSVNLVNIPSHVKLGNTDSTASGAVLYNDANRSSYDYVSFEHLVISIGGIEIGDGDYLLPGATKTTEVLPSGTTAYAQRVGNKLNLVNFTYTGTTASGIESNGSLNLVVVGTNKLTVGNNFGIDVALDLTISGAGMLTITGDDTCIYAGTGCTTGATTLKLTSNSRNGIQVLYGNFTMNDGDLDIYAKNDGINAERVTINGGTALIKSNNMTSDSTYSSIWTGNFVVGSGLRVLGSADPTGSVATDIDVSKLRTYDYIKVQAGTAPPVVSGVTVSGKVTSYITTGTVTIKLFKSGSSTAAYTATVSAASGTATAFSLNNVAAGTYTMEVSKDKHATRTYTITVGSSNVTQDAKICPIGDLNADGQVNAKDYKLILQHINKSKPLTGYALECANINGDANVNAKDMKLILQHVNKSKPLF